MVEDCILISKVLEYIPKLSLGKEVMSLSESRDTPACVIAFCYFIVEVYWRNNTYWSDVKMGKRKTYEEVYDAIKNVGYVLISKEYTNPRTKLDIMDEDGYMYSLGLQNILANKTGLKRFINTNPHTIYNIDKYLEINGDNTKLITREYADMNTNMLFRCGKCGSEFKTTINSMVTSNKITCNECSKKRVLNYNKHTYDHIKEYIETTSECKLVSKEYQKNTSKLKLICECGETFITTFAGFKAGCDKCSKCRNKENRRRIDYNTVKDAFSNKGLTLLDEEYLNNSTKMTSVDKDGYKIFASYSSILNSDSYSIFMNGNPYTIDNIKNYILINEIDSEVIGVEDMIDSNSILILRCKRCGNVYKKSYTSFMHQKSEKRFCPKCMKDIRVEGRKLNVDIVRDRIINAGYMPIFSEYKNATDRIDICDDEGYKYSLRLHDIISKNSIKRKFGLSNPFTIENLKLWIKKSNTSCEFVGCGHIGIKDSITIKCSCGNLYNTTIDKLVHANQSKCRECTDSTGEIVINSVLENFNIEYIRQKSFKNLIGLSGGLLTYDFYLPLHNLLIEYQGGQHEKPVDYFGGIEQFEKQQEHDRRKSQYCVDNNIKLLEIWYWDYDNIEDILKKELKL